MDIRSVRPRKRSSIRQLQMSLDSDIAELDLECIAFKVAWDEKWPLSKIDEVELSYRWFLQAIRKSPGETLAPQKAVDIFWHHHILDTRKYMYDCERLFGRYIHHFPYTGVFGDEDAAKQHKRFQRTTLLITRLQNSHKTIRHED